MGSSLRFRWGGCRSLPLCHLSVSTTLHSIRSPQYNSLLLSLSSDPKGRTHSSSQRLCWFVALPAASFSPLPSLQQVPTQPLSHMNQGPSAAALPPPCMAHILQRQKLQHVGGG